MLAHRYVQAFYTDWVYKLWHSTQIGHIFELSKMYPICVESLRIKKNHKCDSCEKSFSQAGGLKIHIKLVHNGQKDHKQM